MWQLLRLTTIFLRCIPALFRSRSKQAIVELTLRQQLARFAEKGRRPRIAPADRGFWVLLSQLWSVSQFANENGWRARKVRAELAKLGISVGLATVSRYLPKRDPDHDQRVRWKTFLRNHKNGVAAMDFLVVPTARFRLLYAWFVIGHGRREIIHFGLTEHPTSSWVVQHLREAFPNDTSPKFLIYDNDSIFSERVTETIENIGIAPRRTAFRSPWQNGIAERWIGSVRRELLDHVIVLNENHLHRLLREYVDYYNADRVHTELQDSLMGPTHPASTHA